MANERSLAIGVAYVGYGAYPGNGVPASSFTQITEVHKGTVAFNFADPNQVKIEVEGRDDPWKIVNRKGDADSIEFAIPSPTAAELAAFCGGKATGDKWEAPDVMPQVNMTLKINTEPYEGKYVEYVVVNGSVSAKLSQAPGAEQTDLLLVKVSRQSALTTAGEFKPSFTREVKAVTPPSGGA